MVPGLELSSLIHRSFLQSIIDSHCLSESDFKHRIKSFRFLFIPQEVLRYCLFPILQSLSVNLLRLPPESVSAEMRVPSERDGAAESSVIPLSGVSGW